MAFGVIGADVAVKAIRSLGAAERITDNAPTRQSIDSEVHDTTRRGIPLHAMIGVQRFEVNGDIPRSLPWVKPDHHTEGEFI